MVAKRVTNMTANRSYIQALVKLGKKSKDIYDTCCAGYGPGEVFFNSLQWDD